MKSKVLVTGCAGFIGSHLTERLLEEGYYVKGIDSLTNYYSPNIKKRNMKGIIKSDKFKFLHNDLLYVDLSTLLKDVDYIFHLAAQPGVRASWGKNFKVYIKNNLFTTQKLLESAKNGKLKKFVYASSSSIYGDVNSCPMRESDVPRPISPYGVSKLAAENVCYLFWKNFNVPMISLRYFTVYGPRQRPDMAFHKFIKASLDDGEVTVYGDGSQTRDFTYVSDVVEATMLAMESAVEGETFNIGGGSNVSINDALNVIANITGKYLKRKYKESWKGDIKHTLADITKAQTLLGYKPQIKLEEGLKMQIESVQEPICK